MTRVLRGVTWDHPRGYDPLAKGAPLFAAKHPDCEIEWTRRSLRDFGVQPVEALAERFDILVIDHPFCGRAKATGCLLDLRPLFPAEFFAMLEGESVGPSTRSYEYGDGVWGLPTDAAAQVASYRPDLLAALGFDAPPQTFAEVIGLGKAARKAGKWLGLPGVQSDAACLVASLAANVGSPISRDADRLLPTEAFRDGARLSLAIAAPLPPGVAQSQPDQDLRGDVVGGRYRLHALRLWLYELFPARREDADPLYDDRRTRT